jgi:hypothetical protein
MTKEEALQHALGYAAGREDESGIRTASPTSLPGFIAFAEAYAEATDAFNKEQRHYVPSAGSAYAEWQESRGQRIIPPTMAAFDSGPRAPALEVYAAEISPASTYRDGSPITPGDAAAIADAGAYLAKVRARVLAATTNITGQVPEWHGEEIHDCPDT